MIRLNTGLSQNATNTVLPMNTPGIPTSFAVYNQLFIHSFIYSSSPSDSFIWTRSLHLPIYSDIQTASLSLSLPFALLFVPSENRYKLQHEIPLSIPPIPKSPKGRERKRKRETKEFLFISSHSGLFASSWGLHA